MRKRWWCRNGIQVVEYHTEKRHSPGEHRRKKENPTPEKKRQLNERRKAMEVQRLILNNFGEGDKYVTLTYHDAPDEKECRRDIRHLMDWLRRKYTRTGAELKWIRNIERTKRGVIHIHMLVNNLPGTDMGREIRKWWKGRHGTIVKVSDTYLDGGFGRLARYLSKTQRDEKGDIISSFSRSRNLAVPEPETKEFTRWNVRSRGEWRDIRVPKGFELVKESVYEGINQVTGYPYRYYTMIRAGT